MLDGLLDGPTTAVSFWIGMMVGGVIGSAATQSTLVLGLLPRLGAAFVLLRREVLVSASSPSAP